MLKQIVFEWVYRKGRPAGYIYAILLGLLSFILAADGVFGSQQVNIFSGYMLSEFFIIFSLFGILIISAIMVVPMYRDIEHDTIDLTFSLPNKSGEVFWGRFLGSFTVLILLFFLVCLGVYLGSELAPILKWSDKLNFGNPSLVITIKYFVVFLLPNLFILATFFFSAMVIFRNVQIIYLGGILFYILYLISATLSSDIENADLASLLDPLGIKAFGLHTKFWSPVEMNSTTISVGKNFIYNRIIWLFISSFCLWFSYYKFDFISFRKVSFKKAKVGLRGSGASLVKPFFEFKPPTPIQFIFSSARIYLFQILREPFFFSMAALSFVFLIFDLYMGNEKNGTPSYPTTYAVLEGINSGIVIFLIILIVYAGELIHKERIIRYNVIADSQPHFTGNQLISKLLTFVVIAIVFIILFFIIGVLWQMGHGYNNINWLFYFGDLFKSFLSILSTFIICFAIHSFVSNKFLGHVLAITYLGLPWLIKWFTEFDHYLAIPDSTPEYTMSDLSGFVPSYWPSILLTVYWLLFGCIVLNIAYLFWKRGFNTSIKHYFKLLKPRYKEKSFQLYSLGLLILFVIIAGFTFYNTNVLNKFYTDIRIKKDRLLYEKSFKKYDSLPVPRFIDAEANVQIYNSERKIKYDIKGRVVNDAKLPIDSIFLINNIESTSIIWNNIKLNASYISPDLAMSSNRSLQFCIFKLPTSFLPGDTISMVYTNTKSVVGIMYNDNRNGILKNNAFLRFSLSDIFGYKTGTEWNNEKDRKKNGLAIKSEYLPLHTDSIARKKNFLNTAGLINLRMKVITDPGLIAVVPGNLVGKGEDQGRPFFVYQTVSPIVDYFCIVSGKYDIYKDLWTRNGDSVAMLLYHHQQHDFNLKSFTNGLKDGLDFLTTNFGSYAHDEIRIIEFPKYGAFAQSFSQTIPFSESGGWIADLRDSMDFNYPYYVTTHELAHQWWGHQLIPAHVQGGNLLSEGLAEYSAMMISEKRFGRERVGKYLRINLDEYLINRRSGRLEETPLVNSQTIYQDYNKSAIVFYAMKHYLGEKWLNGHLSVFLEANRLPRDGRYAAAIDLYEQFKADCPDSLKYLLEDYWEKLCLYDLALTNANTKIRLSDTSYDITLKVKVDKKYYNGKGEEQTENRVMSDYIEIVVFGSPKGKRDKIDELPVIYRQMYKFKKGEHEVKLNVKGKPYLAGIDPYSILIDRDPKDNVKSIDSEIESNLQSLWNKFTRSK